MSCPLLFNSIDVEYSCFLTVLYDVACGCTAGEVDQEAYFAHKDFIEDLFVVWLSDGEFDELNFGIWIWEMLGFWIYDGHFVEAEVPFDERDSASADGAVSDNADVVDVSVEGITFHRSTNLLYYWNKIITIKVYWKYDTCSGYERLVENKL